MTDLSLRVARKVNAPIEAVFNAWLNPEMLAKFMIPGPGMSVPKATADAREGGRFEIVMSNGERDLPHGGTYLTINRHSQLVFTWESEFSAPGSTVTLNLSPATGGGTDIELIHVKFHNEEARANHEGGWGMILDQMAAQLAG